jgi:hypothetical protein
MNLPSITSAEVVLGFCFGASLIEATKKLALTGNRKTAIITIGVKNSLLQPNNI